MDKTIPPAAARILDFIGNTEAPLGYDTIYGNNQGKLPKPVTKMTVDEVSTNQPIWTRRYGSSATGRYQFMRATLNELKKELKLNGSEKFDADLQDRLGLHLLLRRGYAQWINGDISTDHFMLNLSKEWASFPVPFTIKGGSRTVTRGQSYYAGDGLNKALITPESVEMVLRVAYAAERAGPPAMTTADLSRSVTIPTEPGIQGAGPTVKLSWWQRFRKAFRGEAA